MKNKAIIAAIIAIMIGVLIFVVIRYNTSMKSEDAAPELSSQAESTEPMADIETGISSPESIPDYDDTDDIVTREVQSVSTVILNEAIKINDGNIGEFYSKESYEDVIPVDIRTFSKSEIPAKYDSRDVNGKRYITEIEDQGYTSLCWSYSAIASVEADILSHHSDIDYSDLNLSEKHLAYYNLHKAEGSVNGYIDNDYRKIENAENEDDDWIFDYDTNYVSVGGVSNFVISLLTAWKGPVTETGEDAFKSLYGQKYIYEDNYDEPSDAFNSEYHVQAVSEILASEENRDMVKQMIMEHGAVTASVNADNQYWRNHNRTLYSAFGGEPVPTANHEVVIVGWDDDYSGSNFVTSPKKDGAWLCRNSWGNFSGEGGYFYLSYYDETTCNNNVAGYSVVLKGEKDWYDNNYQLCGFLDNVVSALDDSQNYVTAYTESQNPYAVLYEASSDESLMAVGLMGIDTYQQYDIEIYVNPEMTDDQFIGFNKLMEPENTTKVSAISGGYHTYELSKPVKLNKGDNFLVLVNPASSGILIYENTADNVGDANYDEWNNLTGNIRNNYEASRRSYYIADDGTGLLRQDDKDFFVKAYTNNN
ncbi:C1 family peptidase [Butyrivibrio sp. MC2021]|uniref:C1 family peptidase n=1 Tax=Butyrivibrio sp. MC2021 TaxID=1408306 RepID=UPI00047D142F|nr:C1 family peptidase [Butyrivibrio sp. MC2021]